MELGAPTATVDGTLGLCERTRRKLELNHKRNKEQDHTDAIDAAATAFDYAACKDSYWNPEEFSLLYGTRLWEQASAEQRKILNHLYWVAYYAQIVSAEIATIYFNQTSAAGLYQIEDFRPVCDNLDLETAQERAHIAAFKRVGEAIEQELFGERIFTYPMRTPFAETMIFHDTTRIKAFWKSLQLRAFGMLSSGNAFIGCQYFTIRGLRTLNGKMVQHRLARFAQSYPGGIEAAPIPARISHYHFMDESFHFNSSVIIGHDVVKSLKPPTAFEKALVNKAIAGCQKDHSTFSTAINGLFWYDPALYKAVYKVLRSPVFGMDHGEAREVMIASFAEESEGAHRSAETHRTAHGSYKAFVESLPFVSRDNREMAIMGRMSLDKHLAVNRRAIHRFFGEPV